MLNRIEGLVRVAGIAALLSALALLAPGIGHGTLRAKGRSTGRARDVLRLPVYVLGGVPYFGVCWALWRPIRPGLSPAVRAAALVIGLLLFVPGLVLVLWGRLALGDMYNVSSGLGVHLFADHRLVTDGPYAVVRHPVYLGLRLASLGSLFIYRTWTFAFVALSALALELRARREEAALGLEFGQEWDLYRRSVPAWLPHVRYRPPP